MHDFKITVNCNFFLTMLLFISKGDTYEENINGYIRWIWIQGRRTW